MRSAADLSASLIAETFVERTRGRAIGVIGENLPAFSESTLASELQSKHAGPFRLAMLGFPNRQLKSTKQMSVSLSETEANAWRNDEEAKDGRRLFVLVSGAVSKLTSLRSVLRQVGEPDLRDTLKRRAIGFRDTPQRKAFWECLADDLENFPISTLLEYAAPLAHIASQNPHDVEEYERQRHWVLGLLRDDRLLSMEGKKKVWTLLKANLALVARLSDLSKQDLHALSKAMESDDASSTQYQTAKRILSFSESKRNDHLNGLGFEDVLAFLSESRKGSKPELPKDETPVKKQRMLGDEAAVRDILNHDGDHLTDIAEAYDNSNEGGSDEIKVAGDVILTKTRLGTSQVSAAVSKVVSPKSFGGVITVDADDYVEALKHLDGGESSSIVEFLPQDPNDEYSIQRIVERATNLYGASLNQDVLKLWQEYVTCREQVIGSAADLVDHPLLALGSREKGKESKLLKDCEALIVAYGRMMAGLVYLRRVLADGNSEEFGKTLVSRGMALDVIYLRFGAKSVAIAGPTHPFHLWRWVQIAKLLHQHRQELKELGDDIVLKHTINPPVSSPHLCLNNHVIDDADPAGQIYMGVGSLGSLPLYGPPESRTAAKFQIRAMGDILDHFLGVARYAEFGLEAVLVDPPSLPEALDALLSVNRSRSQKDTVPLHIRIFRTREAPSFTDEEDAEMEDITAALREIRGSLEMEPNRVSMKEIVDRVQARPTHYVAVFEPGDSERATVSVTLSPTLSPLVIPRHYAYDPMADRFDVIIQGTATPFADYYKAFRDVNNIREGNNIGRRSGASRWIPLLGDLAKHAMWISVVDQGIEPTFTLPGTIRLDRRHAGGHDIHTFTAHQDTIDRYIEKVIRMGGLVPDLPTRKRALGLMRHLGGDTIPLAVSTASANEQVVGSQARGLLGTLAVTAWYEKFAPDALLVSLDTEASRRWILGAIEDDARRGDLLCIRQTKDGLHLEIIEAKAHDEHSGLYKVIDGGKNGTRIEGSAVGQIDCTTTILRRIVPTGELSAVDCARREILRDQLYMAVATRTLSGEQRARAVRMLDEFFSGGPQHVTGRLFLVHVESGGEASYPAQPLHKGKSPGGHAVEVFQIVETEAKASQGGADGGGPPPEPPPAPEPPATPGRGTKRREPGGTAAPSEQGTRKRETGRKKERETAVSKAAATPEAGTDSGTVEAPATMPAGLSVMIGKDPVGNDITWDTTKNPNFGFLITGDSGSGKSQTIRAVMHEVRKAKYPVMVFDFKNDYSDADFVQALGLQVYDVVADGLPFNPLSLAPNESGLVQPIRHCYDFASIVARVEGLGEQQTNRLVEAMSQAYEAHGLNPRSKLPIDQVKSLPVFQEVIDHLDHMDDSKAESVMYRMKKFVDLNLFPAAPTGRTFESLIDTGTVFTLNDASNDNLMKIMAEIMIVKLHAILKRGQQPRALRRLLVFDEAWRVAQSERLSDLAREGRAFGVGLLIGTQNPRDLPDTLISCLRTQVFLFNKDIENQRTIVRALCNTISGPHAQRLLTTVANLGQFQGYIKSEQYKDPTRVNVVPHYQRV